MKPRMTAAALAHVDTISAAARALLLAHHAPKSARPPDSFTVDDAVYHWGIKRVAAMSRLQRGFKSGLYGRTMICKVAYYHAPAPKSDYAPAETITPARVRK